MTEPKSNIRAERTRARGVKPRRPTTNRAGSRRAPVASPNLEQYVETIAHLLTKDKVCTVSEIAEVAQVTRPAVSRAVRELKQKELVVHKAYGYVDLTEKGRALARRLTARHEALYRFLKEVLHYDEATADREACRLEHQVDDEFVGRLTRLREFIESDARVHARWREDGGGGLAG